MDEPGHSFEYPLNDWADLHARIRRFSGTDEDILGILGLKKRVHDSFLCDMPGYRRDLFASRVTDIFEARNVIVYLKSRYDEAQGIADEQAMAQWRDLLRKAYHMQLIPAVLVLGARGPDGFFKELFHSSSEDAYDYLNTIRSEAGGYLKGIGLDL